MSKRQIPTAREGHSLFKRKSLQHLFPRLFTRFKVRVTGLYTHLRRRRMTSMRYHWLFWQQSDRRWLRWFVEKWVWKIPTFGLMAWHWPSPIWYQSGATLGGLCLWKVGRREKKSVRVLWQWMDRAGENWWQHCLDKLSQRGWENWYCNSAWELERLDPVSIEMCIKYINNQVWVIEIHWSHFIILNKPSEQTGSLRR